MFALELLAHLESRHAAAKAWIDRTSRAFFKKNGGQDLMEVSERWWVRHWVVIRCKVGKSL